MEERENKVSIRLSLLQGEREIAKFDTLYTLAGISDRDRSRRKKYTLQRDCGAEVEIYSLLVGSR